VNNGKKARMEPRDRPLKRLVTRMNLFFLGMGFQTAYRVDPVVKDEIDTWPETFTFVLSVVNGPRMVVQKRNGSVQYLGGKETFFADLELTFKHIEYAFMAVTGKMTAQEATCHNRQFVKGDLSVMMSAARVINRIQALLIPKWDSVLRDEPFWQVNRTRALLYYNASFGTIK
jgi:hypothetical protein